VRKARRAGALYGGREPSGKLPEPLGFRVLMIVRSLESKDAKGRKKGRSFFPGVF
jgi:hypothetical protein